MKGVVDVDAETEDVDGVAALAATPPINLMGCWTGSFWSGFTLVLPFLTVVFERMYTQPWAFSMWDLQLLRRFDW